MQEIDHATVLCCCVDQKLVLTASPPPTPPKLTSVSGNDAIKLAMHFMHLKMLTNKKKTREMPLPKLSPIPSLNSTFI